MPPDPALSCSNHGERSDSMSGAMDAGAAAMCPLHERIRGNPMTSASDI